MKDLPKMYRNKIEKEIRNNEKIFSTIYNNEKNIIEKEERSNNQKITTKKAYTVEQKIANIFNSPNYIYKIDVVIITDTERKNKRIVGKTKTDLITIENEYIPINTIRDIYINK